MVTVITGSRGFIGSHLVRLLKQDEMDVVGVGRTPGPAAGPHGSRYHACPTDDPANLLPYDRHDDPFALVHLAWDTTRPPHYSRHANQVHWLARVLDHWTDRGLAAVVAAGSAEEFGERGGVIAEDDPPAGRLSAYGWGKAAARTLLQSWAEGTGRPTLWLRPFVVYGPGQGGNMAVPYAIRQALDGLPAEFSDGVQRRDFVHVDDVAEAFRAALRVLSPGFTAVNVGTGKGTALRAVLELIGELTGAGKRFHFGARPRRSGEPLLQVAATDHAATVLGWRAKVDWADGVCRLVESARRAA